MTIDIVCNFRKCRRALSNHAWVTTCSHAFCVEHGKQEFKRNADNILTCPACGNELRDKFDVIQADLKPSETFKSIVLAGMKPDVIMDIAMRAMSFWSYQVEQETHYHESVNQHLHDKIKCLSEVSTLNAQKLKTELETYKRKIANLQAEFNKKRKQAEELSAHLEEKSRKIQKLSYQLDAHKRKDIHSEGYKNISHNPQEECMDISDLVMNKTSMSDKFTFRPNTTTDDFQKGDTSMNPLLDFRKNIKKKRINFLFKPNIK